MDVRGDMQTVLRRRTDEDSAKSLKVGFASVRRDIVVVCEANNRRKILGN
jgi:hypothetical protein